MPQSNLIVRKQANKGGLVLASVGILALLAWLVASFGRAHGEQVEFAREEQQLEQVVRQLMMLDEALTMSAQLFVGTGEERWLDRHAMSAEELAGGVAGLLEQATPELAVRLEETTSLFLPQRLETEQQAIHLAQAGERENAMGLFLGLDYGLAKESYREGLLTHRAGMAYHHNGKQQRAVLKQQAFAALGLLALLTAIGLGVYGARQFSKDQNREQALADQRADHAKLLAALDCVADGIVITDRKATITYVNDAYCGFTGYSKEVLIGSSTQILKSEELLDDVYDEIWSTLRGGEPWAGRLYYKRWSGSDQYEGCWSSLHLTPLVHGDGDGDRLSGFIGIQRDISAEVRAEEEANLLHEFATVLARVGAKLDESGEVEEIVSSALAELTFATGFREDLGAAVLRVGGANGESPTILAACGGFERFDSTDSLEFGQPLTQGELRTYQVFIGLNDDLLPAEELAGYMLVPFGEEGGAGGALVVGCEGRVAGDPMFAEMLESVANLFGSRTARAHVRASLQESVDTATRANRLKTRFLAKMSQEIRTPMTSIVGYSDLLLDGERSAEDHVYASGMIREGARELLELVDGIIDMSSMESGALELDCSAVSPLEVLSRVVQSMAPKAREKGIRLEMQVEGKVPAEIFSDPKRLRQVFSHLVGNAIKFTEVGTVTARVRVLESEQNGVLQVDVIDTGIGILANQRSKLFQPFQHADAGSTRRNSGAGLGLAISRGLVRLLGGELSLGDSEHTGSTFTIRLPIGKLDAHDMAYWEDLQGGTSAESGDSSIPLPYRLLLAEDNNVNQRIISKLLSNAGAEVEIAATGLEAVKFVACAVQASMPFDAVLMDLMMPEMDGLTATRQLREQGHSLPIIALTADARIRTSIRCKEAGCDGFATKPVDREELFTLLSERIIEHHERVAKPAG